MHVYKNTEGEATGFITFHVNNIKVLAFPKSKRPDEQTNSDSKPKQDNSEDTGNPPF
jgi:single-strand DNA-binding protein